MPTHDQPSTTPADPSLWSEKSKQSYAFNYIREYKDIPYKCWHCQADCLFTALDQKYTFEVKKASIDQRRTLCSQCWSESHRIRNDLQNCEDQWAAAKQILKSDKDFLSHWLQLLTLLEKYVPYKPDTAKKNMLGKLLADA
jgi:hypothetical protein